MLFEEDDNNFVSLDKLNSRFYRSRLGNYGGTLSSQQGKRPPANLNDSESNHVQSNRQTEEGFSE
jgi:hypothetical protein